MPGGGRAETNEAGRPPQSLLALFSTVSPKAAWYGDTDMASQAEAGDCFRQGVQDEHKLISS